MKYITISALTMEEAETMLKILDKWIRHYYNSYGVQRLTSWNRRANDGIRAQIIGKIDYTIWDYVKFGVMHEITERFEKGLSYHLEGRNHEVIDFCTCEAGIE